MANATLRYVSTTRRQRQSGVIPYRLTEESLDILLITNRSGRRLIVPKGAIPARLSPIASAQKEALEEAGVEGMPHFDSIGVMTANRRGERCIVELWPMRVTLMHARWPEMSRRERIWLPFDEATNAVGRHDLARLIERLAERVLGTRATAAA